MRPKGDNLGSLKSGEWPPQLLACPDWACFNGWISLDAFIDNLLLLNIIKIQVPTSVKRACLKHYLPAADNAARNSRLGLFAAISGESCQMEYRRDDAARIQRLPGTLIHNGKFCLTPAVGSLPVALIKSSFQSLSMAEVCSSTLLSAGFGAATLTAILLAVIAAAADPENRVTFVPTAKPLAENIFRVASHSHPKARLDKRHPIMSAYGRVNMEPLDQRFYQWTPVADSDRGLFLLDLPQEVTRLIG